jgi:glycosyltransferase involved in cell wall biosynthesis
MRPAEPVPALCHSRTHLVVYLGIMGPQDGVDGVLRVAEHVVRRHGRDDVRFALLGFGDCLADLKKQCTELGLDDFVEFTGRVGPPQIAEYLSTASAGLSPDPMSPLNDVSTMNKTMEYMAYALPVVAYRLTETVVSGGSCVVYVEPGDEAGFADTLVTLLDDADRRAELGAAGRRRAVRELDWRPQAQAYVSVFDGLFGLRRANKLGIEADTADEQVG